MEQPGVLACLSRRRSWVQIPSGTLIAARYANRKSGEAQTFVTLLVRLPPVLLKGSCSSWLPVKQSSQNKRGGRREVQFLHDPLTMARSSNGRMRDPHSRDAGSIPARVTDNSQVVELGYTRRSERRALCGMGVRISPWLLITIAGEPALSRAS